MSVTKPCTEHFILKISGKHGLVFKTKHNNKGYLEDVAKQLLEMPDSNFTSYEIHDSDHANSEMTEPDHLIHLDPAELHSID